MARNFSAEILLISGDILTEDGLSTELEISPGPQNFGENVPDVYQSRKNLACKPLVFDGISKVFHGGVQRWTGEVFRFFCKHKIKTIFFAFFVECRDGIRPRNSLVQTPYCVKSPLAISHAFVLCIRVFRSVATMVQLVTSKPSDVGT